MQAASVISCPQLWTELLIDVSLVAHSVYCAASSGLRPAFRASVIAHGRFDRGVDKFWEQGGSRCQHRPSWDTNACRSVPPRR